MELFHVIVIIIGMISLSYAVSANFKAKEDGKKLLNSTNEELKKQGITPSMQEVFIADKFLKDMLAETGKSDCSVKVCGIACDSQTRKIATISSAGLSIRGFDELLSCSTIIDNQCCPAKQPKLIG